MVKLPLESNIHISYRNLFFITDSRLSCNISGLYCVCLSVLIIMPMGTSDTCILIDANNKQHPGYSCAEACRNTNDCSSPQCFSSKNIRQ